MNEMRLMKMADEFFRKNIYPPGVGRITDESEFDKIDSGVLGRIPTWYRNLIARYPIVGLEIGLPNDHGDVTLKDTPFEQLPLMGIHFLSIKELEASALNFFPGYLLFEKGYIQIAEDKFVTQEGIYINTNNEDPAMLLVFHDIGDDIDDILMNSEKLLDHFSDIFKYGKRRYLIPYTN